MPLAIAIPESFAHSLETDSLEEGIISLDQMPIDIELGN